MISDFIWIELIQQSENRLCFSCNLPDPNPYTEEKMITCGNIVLQKEMYSPCETLEITLFQNFMSLCIGETYQRYHFVQTILYILQNKFGVLVTDVNIKLFDSWGSSFGKLADLDRVIRGVEE